MQVDWRWHIAFAAGLPILAMSAPWLSAALTNDIRLVAGRGSVGTPPPGATGLVMLGLCSLIIVLVARPLVRRLFAGGWRSAILASIVLAFSSLLFWLALSFFTGNLPGVSRLFAFVHALTFFVLLVASHLIVSVMGVQKSIATVLGCAIAYFALDGYASQMAAGPASGGWLRPWLEAASSLTRGLFAWGHGRLGDLNASASPEVPPITLPTIAPSSAISLSFLAAAVATTLLQRRFLSELASVAGPLVDGGFWIVGTHAVWLAILFTIGLTDVPRWLPLVTIATMAAVTLGRAVLPLMTGGPQGVVAALASGGGSTDADTRAEIVPPTTQLPNRVGKRAWIISYTGVSNEPRVLRQSQALISAGWDVVVCGYDGHSPRPPEWTFVRLPARAPYTSQQYKVLEVMQRLGKFAAVYGWPRVISEKGGRLAHETNALWLHTKSELVAIALENPDLKPDLVACHDYHTSDVGYVVAKTTGARFSVDVHEYAAGQYFNDPDWVKWQRPIAVSTQRNYLSKADVITVVCDGIGDLLAKENPLKTKPVTIRGLPSKNAQPFRPVGKRIEVLYHGDLSVRREIHTLIESIPRWRGEFDLRLRGAGDPAYIGDLKRRVARLGLEKRVFFEASVPFDQIIPAANKSDIGFFSFRGDSPQIRFTLPNKFFEYIMAGLCVCVGDTEEVGRVVREYKLGRLISPHSPEGIAEAINSLTPQDIEDFKRASLAAADVLNWENERRRLLAAYDGVGGA